MTEKSQRVIPILPQNPGMQDFQEFVHGLESFHGWLDVDLVHNCFLMGEEVGELFKAIRKHLKYYEQPSAADTVEGISEEIVDVLNYILAIANRLNIDVEAAFRKKNALNLKRTWD